MLPLPATLSAGRRRPPGLLVRGSFQGTVVVAMTQTPPTSVDQIPAVCLEDDLANIFRLPLRHVKLWRRMPEFIPFPPLPSLDRQLRVSGCVVAWFLAQEAGEYYRTFKEPLEKLAAVNRRRRIPWWRFTAPHKQGSWALPLEGERPTLSVKDVAQTLRVGPSSFRRAANDPEFPMPPASRRPLRWTPGQAGAPVVGACGLRGPPAASGAEEPWQAVTAAGSTSSSSATDRANRLLRS